MTKEVMELGILGGGKGVGQNHSEGGHTNERSDDVFCGPAAWAVRCGGGQDEGRVRREGEGRGDEGRVRRGAAIDESRRLRRRRATTSVREEADIV